MAWIELHQEFRDHPKVARLAAKLNVDYCLAQAYLINLWLWACSYARNGDLSRFTVLEIAEAAKSKIEATLFVEVLTEIKWIDRADDKILLHDWKKYGLRILESSKKRVAKSRRESKLKKHDVTLLKCNSTAYLSFLSNLSIPSNHSILSPQFGVVWDEWIDYRLQRKKPVTEISGKQQLKFLSQQPDPIACISESIRNGWQGIFELKKNGQPQQKIVASRPLPVHRCQNCKCDFTGPLCPKCYPEKSPGRQEVAMPAGVGQAIGKLAENLSAVKKQTDTNEKYKCSQCGGLFKNLQEHSC